MTNISIERIHTNLNQQIKLVQAYLENPKIKTIIKTCRLLPKDFNGSKKLILHRWWVDEFGNSFIINEDKKIEIIYNDLRIKRDKSTDLYYGLSLNKIVKMSTMIHIIAGKDEDLKEECYLLTFYGIDKHFRSYLYWHGEWSQVSTLVIGIENIQLLINYLDLQYFKQLWKYKKKPIPCNMWEGWISCLPADQDFMNIISKKFETLLPFFKMN